MEPDHRVQNRGISPEQGKLTLPDHEDSFVRISAIKNGNEREIYQNLKNAATKTLQRVEPEVPALPSIQRATHIEDLSLLEEKIGFQFSNPEILEMAVGHGSSSVKDRVVKRRLFTGRRRVLSLLGGDAIRLVAAQHFFHKWPNATEGRLTSITDSNCRTSRLAEYSDVLGLSDFIRIDPTHNRQQVVKNNRVRGFAFRALFGAIVAAHNGTNHLPVTIPLLTPHLSGETVLLNPKNVIERLCTHIGGSGTTVDFHFQKLSQSNSVPRFCCSLRGTGLIEFESSAIGKNKTQLRKIVAYNLLKKISEMNL